MKKEKLQQTLENNKLIHAYIKSGLKDKQIETEINNRNIKFNYPSKEEWETINKFEKLKKKQCDL